MFFLVYMSGVEHADGCIHSDVVMLCPNHVFRLSVLPLLAEMKGRFKALRDTESMLDLGLIFDHFFRISLYVTPHTPFDMLLIGC